MTDSYVLLGGNVADSPMPRMMNAAFRGLGIDAEYRASEAAAASLPATFARLKESGASGLNVTMPHKTSIARLLDSLDAVAARIGAVNTVKGDRGSYKGYNTDAGGILEPLKSRGLSRPSRAFVLGTGGASRAFCEAMHELGCRELVALSRDPASSSAFLNSMVASFPDMRIEVASLADPPAEGPELFFNASPVGANGMPLPGQVARLLEGRPLVFDAVYFPVETELLRVASELGCRLIRGHEMLLHQALKSFRIWTGRTPPSEVMRLTLLDSLGVSEV